MQVNTRTAGAIAAYVSEVIRALGDLPVDRIGEVVMVLEEARKRGGRVYVFGNGGSASTASHLACDLSKGAICPGKPRIRAIALADNLPLLTAWANDTEYASVFAEQVDNLVEAGDVVIGISGSGNSSNVLEAMRIARSKGAVTVGFCGYDGGLLKGLVDVAVIVPSDNMEQIEDAHLLIAHAIKTCLRDGIR